MSKELSLNERITLAISGIALAVAVVSPFVTYQWLQNTVREQNLKATALRAYATGYSKLNDPNKGIDGGHTSFIAVYVTNTGPLAVNDVTVSHAAGAHRSFKDYDLSCVNIVPPAPFDAEVKNDTLYITFKSPFPPGETRKVTFHDVYDRTVDLDLIPEPAVWLSSEAAPSIPVYLNGDASLQDTFRRTQKIAEP